MSPPMKFPERDLLKLAAQSQVAFVMVQHQTEFQATDRRQFIRELMVEGVYNALTERATIDVRFGDPTMVSIHPTIEPMKLTAAEMALIEVMNQNDELLKQLQIKPCISVTDGAMKEIQGVLSGTEWSPDTLDEIADICRRAGYEIADIPEDA